MSAIQSIVLFRVQCYLKLANYKQEPQLILPVVAFKDVYISASFQVHGGLGGHREDAVHLDTNKVKI